MRLQRMLDGDQGPHQVPNVDGVRQYCICGASIVERLNLYPTVRRDRLQ